jgi:hypothetical protein
MRGVADYSWDIIALWVMICVVIPIFVVKPLEKRIEALEEKAGITNEEPIEPINYGSHEEIPQ